MHIIHANTAFPLRMTQDETKLAAALMTLVSTDEYYLDYLAYTSPNKLDLESVDDAQMALAREGVEHAVSAFKRSNIPFFPPATFETERYRNPKLMARIAAIAASHAKDAKRRQERRRAILEKKSQDENRGKAERTRRYSARVQKEVIERWKEARKAAKSSGMNEEQVKLEDIYRVVEKERHYKRVSKNKKYGLKKKSRKNDAESAFNDRYRHRYFEHK